MSLAILGGIFLNIGAFLTYKGRIYQAVITYLCADVCWMIMAYQKEDYLGFVFITVGTIYAFLAYLKMKNGAMNKTLHKEINDL